MNKTSNPIIFMYKKLWEFSTGTRSKIIGYSLLFVLANVVDFFPPLIIAKILNIIQEQGITSANLWTLILWFSFFIAEAIIFWIFHGPARVIEITNAYFASINYKQYLLDGTMDLPANWHTDHHSGDTIDKIEKASMGLRNFSDHTFEIIEVFIRFISSFVVIAYFDLSLSIVVILIVVGTIFLITRFDKILILKQKIFNKMQNKVAAKVYDIVSNITTIIILSIQKLISRSLSKHLNEPRDHYRKMHRFSEFKWALVSFCVGMMTFLVMSIFVWNTVKLGNVVLVGTVSALFTYTTRIGNIFYHFSYRYGDIVKWRTDVANVEEISDLFEKKKKVKQVSLKRWKEIEVRDLQFAYEDTKKHKLHLNNISFNIKRNKRIAFIGSSGSGKTTALKVIREIYPTKSVQINLDNKNLPNDFASISSHISLIPQEPEIFSTTIRENITLGVPYSKKKLNKYLKMARFYDVIKRLPQGLDSSIVEKGVNLSGGEKQRLALTRGLLASENKDLVLLDEPTSSVDSKNELDIYNSIFKSFKKKTIISSIHKLYLLPLFDEIYLFKHGKIIANGNFKTLKKSSKEFKLMLAKYEKSLK